ncbi:hypothetical protein [Streptomyces sp. NPDC001404]|uniref:hypothetical protein n=1 Tax=Streptomyces sp. NPDC001404 TaxID=3364571 RepID=UPI0036A1CEE6
MADARCGEGQPAVSAYLGVRADLVGVDREVPAEAVTRPAVVRIRCQGRVLVGGALVGHPEEPARLPVRHLFPAPRRQYGVEGRRPDVPQHPYDRLQISGPLHTGQTPQQRRHHAVGLPRQPRGRGLHARGVVALQVLEKEFDLHVAAR